MTEETAEPEFITIAERNEIPDGQGRAFDYLGVMVAIFRIGDEFYAIDDICPHAGASLAEGNLDGRSVYCPWHAWRFSVEDGTWLDNPRAQLRQASYEVRVVGEQIRIRPRK